MNRKNCLVLLLALFAIVVCSCDGGGWKDNSSEIVIQFKLPENIINNCANDWKYDDFIDNFCLVTGDLIDITIFSATEPDGPYTVYDWRIKTLASMGDDTMTLYLHPDRYYRFFAKVINEEENTKLSGASAGLHATAVKRYDIDLFLGLTADFVRVVADAGEKSSLQTYIPEDDGSSGAGAVALKDGRILLAGGGVFNANGEEEFSKKTNYIDMASLKVTMGPELKEGVKDHVVALIDDADSATGKVVVAFGKTRDGYNANVYLIDPEKDTIESKGAFGGRAHARSLVIGGEVYISGGCDATSGYKEIIKVDKNGAATKWQSMKQGRCLHGMIDVSYTSGGALHPAILVFGGAKRYIDDNTDRYLVGYNEEPFAEVIDENGAQAVAIAGIGCDGSAGAAECFTLAGHGAARIRWDSESKGPAEEVVVLASAGFVQPAIDQDLHFSPHNYLIRGAGDPTKPKSLTWSAEATGTSIKCAYATMAAIGSPEMSPIRYAALNCGAGKAVERSYDTRDEEKIFVLDIHATMTGGDVFSVNVAVRPSITGSPVDINNPGLFLDGPVAVNDLGQVFLFGTRYVYLVSGFSYGDL